MPVGRYSKEEIRRIAEDIGLQVAGKPDSQEICFIPDNDYAGFIEENSPVRVPEGNFVDMEGHVLGRHRGITRYTVGQRKGLNLSMGRPTRWSSAGRMMCSLTALCAEDLTGCPWTASTAGRWK